MSSGSSSVAVVVASGNKQVFGEWLRRAVPNLGNASLFLVPWGGDAADIQSLAARASPKRIEIIPSSQIPTFEGNRNEALRHLKSCPPEFVAFLDDDAFPEEAWLGNMLEAGDADCGVGAFCSRVLTDGTPGNPQDMQSEGHYLLHGSPRDRGFRGGQLQPDPLCPCGNSAFVRWSAIAKIEELDPDVWDPRFRRWQTCFDFGLKLVLTRTLVKAVPAALLRHRGYMTWTEERKAKKASQAVLGQLRSRFLLYEKFFPRSLAQKARDALSGKYPKWREQGYPDFEKWIKGDLVEQFVKQACEEAASAIGEERLWRDLMDKRPDAPALLGFND